MMDQCLKGMIATVAGNGGEPGHSGDGSLATTACLNEPKNLCFDADGNLFIADRRNHRIRKVAPDGIITTVAGNGYRGLSGDGGLAIQASLDHPHDVVVDASGNIFIASQYSHIVRKVDASGIITTVAGTGQEGYW